YSERLSGYKKALEDNDIYIQDDLIIQNVEGMEDAHKVVSSMIGKKGKDLLPDAFLATSDTMAYGVMGALRDGNIDIPGDIAVMGFDDLDVSGYMNPGLTAISQPCYEMGVAAMERLIQIIDGDGEQPKVDMF